MSISKKLFCREHQQFAPNQRLLKQRQLYQYILPSKAQKNVKVPDIIIKKFTPDGKYLVAFSECLHSVQVFEYNHRPSLSLECGQDKSFNDVFKLKYQVNVTSGSEKLSKATLIFSHTATYMIVASAHRYDPDEEFGLQNDPESPALSCLSQLDVQTRQLIFVLTSQNITFWVINISKGVITDKVLLRADFVCLKDNSGITLWENILGITSIQYQSVILYMLKSDGKLLRLQTIGSSLQPDDSFQLQMLDMREIMHKENRVSDNSMLSNCPSIDIRAIHKEYIQTYSVPHTPAQVSDINDTYIIDNSEIENAKCSKNLIVHLNFLKFIGSLSLMQFKPIQRTISTNFLQFIARSQFHSLFRTLSSLILWRSTFISSDVIVLKYSTPDNITKRLSDSSSYLILYVIYNINTAEILHVLNNLCPEMLQLIQDTPELHSFVHAGMLDFQTNATNNYSALSFLYMNAYTVRKAKNGGSHHAIKRVTSHFPYYLQQTSTSPYYDQTLFSYNEKFIGKQVKSWHTGENRVKFFNRQTRQFLFSIDAGLECRSCVYLFHPTDAFCICIGSMGEVWFQARGIDEE